MKIKEAAQICGLTEKAIRLYESRGLITPEIQEKNGRLYREYSEKNIRTLSTIAVLRRADFSMEQIADMQMHPEHIPAVFSAYREQICRDSERLHLLCKASERIETQDGMTVDEFASQIAEAMDQSAHEAEALGTEQAEEWDERIPFIQSVWQMIPPKVRIGLIIGMGILALLLLILHVLCRTTPVQRTEEGVLYNRADGTVTPITVTLDGKLQRFVWREDYFTGEFSVEGFSVGDMIRENLTGAERERFFKRLRIPYERFFSQIMVEKAVPYYESDEGTLLEWNLLFVRGLEGDEPFVLICPVMGPTDASLGGEGHHWSSDDGMYVVVPAEIQDDAEFLVRRMWDLYNEEYPSDMPVDE